MRPRFAARRIGRRLRMARRLTRRMRRRTRRLMRGPAAILLIGGSIAAIKLLQEDLERLEKATGKPADDLTEEELLAAMKRLGIQKLELNAEDRDAIDAADMEE